MAAGNSWREEQLQKHTVMREYSNSNCTRKPVLGASKTEFQHMRYRNHQYMTKIFQFLQKKLGMSASDSTFSMQTSIQNTFIGMENVHVLVDERGHPSWAELFENSEIYKNTKFEETESLFNITQKVGNGTFRRDSVCKMAGIFITVLDEISVIS